MRMLSLRTDRENRAMPSYDLLVTFFITTLLFAYLPGPAMLYVAGQTLARGRRSGLMAVLGVHLGCYAHVIAAAAGLSILFHAVPVLYTTLKLAGAAYLIWLGIAMIRSRGKADATSVEQPIKTGRRAMLESVMVEVLNPKTAMFFTAFLPQFVDPAAAFPVWLQFAILGVIVNCAFSGADMVCVFLAGAITRRLEKSGRAQRLMRGAGGAMLCGIGAHLALQRS